MKLPMLATFALAAFPGLGQAQSSVPTTSKAGPEPPAAIEGRVLVVDVSGVGDFVSLADAVAAAPERALILVKTGVYPDPVVSSGKGITIQADAGATVEIGGAFLVEDVGPQSELTLSGLTFGAGFTVQDCRGSVRIHDCDVPHVDELAYYTGPWQSYTDLGSCGFGDSRQRILRSRDVSLVGCSFEGREGADFAVIDGSPGEHGLLVRRSKVALYHCQLIGGKGGLNLFLDHNVTFLGAGGDGLRVRGPGSQVTSCGLTGHGGDIASAMYPPVPCGGELVRVDAGSAIEACPVDDLFFSVPPIARAGQNPLYTISAPPGSPVFLMAAPSRDRRVFGAAAGILHLGSGLRLFPLGTMPASGVLSRPLPTPAPFQALGHIRVELQAYARVAGSDRYSEPQTVVTVDASL